ncbi:hypothetical protein BT69DRAFT_1286187 [Atractiella rhizophila]|nr:hypothetical protein BT69DRAFT_1286187 [Atractiella rhizophila]
MEHIPAEVVDEILSYVVDISQWNTEKRGSVNKKRFLSWSIVCQRWSGLVRRRAFHTITFSLSDKKSGRIPSVQTLLSALEQYTWLRECVKCFTIRHDKNSRPYLSLLQECLHLVPYLRSVQAKSNYSGDDDILETVLQLLSSKRMNLIKLSGQKTIHLDYLSHIFSDHPDLKSLSVESMVMDFRDQYAIKWTWVSSLFLDCRSITPFVLFRFLEQLPSLEDVELRVVFNNVEYDQLHETTKKDIIFPLLKKAHILVTLVDCDHSLNFVTNNFVSSSPQLRELTIWGAGYDSDIFDLFPPQLEALTIILNARQPGRMTGIRPEFVEQYFTQVPTRLPNLRKFILNVRGDGGWNEGRVVMKLKNCLAALQRDWISEINYSM